jgi:hypothetical protein
MKGLIIKPYWADLILAGEKTWEIRGSRTTIRGRIALIKSGSGKIFGSVDLVNCISLHGPNDYELILNSFNKHHVPLGVINYRKPYAWALENPIKYAEPIPYAHPQGAVIWVNL